MNIIQVDLVGNGYPIYLGSGILSDKALLQAHVPGKQVLIVSDRLVAKQYLPGLQAAFKGYDLANIVLDVGEIHKNQASVDAIYDCLIEKKFDRSCVLIALGGGVVGDLTGFAAATYQRGVGYLQIPTTLLAQVDASVGGKTAINHAKGKNMIGAFHQPNSVIIDTDTLNTLGEQEFISGLAEVVKYGAIGDRPLFDWLESNMAHIINRDQDAVAHIIERSCRNKASFVARDERDNGVRALLNYGHTFAHVIETSTGYEVWSHGQAVAVGMLMAASMSVRMDWLSQQDFDRLHALINGLHLPSRLASELTAQEFIDMMHLDKKSYNKKLRLVLLRSIGDAVLTDDYPAQCLLQTVDAFLNS